jgi:hypothetical protein
LLFSSRRSGRESRRPVEENAPRPQGNAPWIILGTVFCLAQAFGGAVLARLTLNEVDFDAAAGWLPGAP